MGSFINEVLEVTYYSMQSSEIVKNNVLPKQYTIYEIKLA